MPLRDHFHSPMLEQAQWNEIHGSWPTRIMDAVEDVLPPGYAVSSNVKMGRKHEIDIAAYSRDRLRYSNDAGNNGGGGTATCAAETKRGNVRGLDRLRFLRGQRL